MKYLIYAAFLFTATGARGQAAIPDTRPFVLGRIAEINSKILGENRVLNIYLPPDYNDRDTTRYPVIYLLDGSADEDFIHIAGLVQFATFPWVKILPHSIVIGISNIDRRRDFTYPTTIEQDKKDFPTTGGSAKFISFLKEELEPYVDSAYRTANSKTIIGQSLGGLVATEILLKQPELFTDYIIVSPSLWWDNESLLKAAPVLLRNPIRRGVRIYIAAGKEGKRMAADVKKLSDLLKITPNTQVFGKYYPDQDHASILHVAVYDAFKSLFATQQNKK